MRSVAELSPMQRYAAVTTMAAAGFLALNTVEQPQAEAASVAAAAPSTADFKVLQADLNKDLVRYGMPVLKVDGAIGRQSQRALCIERFLTGSRATRYSAGLTKTEIRVLNSRDTLSSPYIPEFKTRISDGMVVSETCQVATVVKANKVVRLFPVSTGKNVTAGKSTETPNGVTILQNGRRGLHNSSLYPAEVGNGNMDHPLYRRDHSTIAVHGSDGMSIGTTTPESHGCIRTVRGLSRILWAENGGPANSTPDLLVRLRPQTKFVETGGYEYNIR